MARSQDDDLLIGDELAAAFLEGDDSLAPAAPTHQPMNPYPSKPNACPESAEPNFAVGRRACPE